MGLVLSAFGLVLALWRFQGRLIDSLAALADIRRAGQPPMTILHGAEDSLIPPRMGRELAAAAPGSVFELVPGAGHADLLTVAEARVGQLLRQR